MESVLVMGMAMAPCASRVGHAKIQNTGGVAERQSFG
jgi:hypothetical protein